MLNQSKEMEIREAYLDYEKNHCIKFDAGVCSELEEPKTKEEAFERLRKYEGQKGLESLISKFKTKFPLNHRTLKDKLIKLNEFIDFAEELNLEDAFNEDPIEIHRRGYHEYLRLKYGYFEKVQFNDYKSFFREETFIIYAKYFLFKDWIKSQIDEFSKREGSNLIIDSIQNAKIESFNILGSSKLINKDDEKSKSEVWFQVGVLFAKGELNKYYNQNKRGFENGYSALKVAKELGNESYEKFILATVNNYSKDNPNGSKNIFNSKGKMEKIIKHLTEQGIPVDDYFLSRLPLE